MPRQLFHLGLILHHGAQEAAPALPIDKVVIDRAARDTIALRLAWRGRATNEIALPITVGSVTELSRSSDMEAAIIARVHAG